MIESQDLSSVLRARIKKEGSISFHDFMEAALYDPRGGYYASDVARIGGGGDFQTNVTAGSLYGRLLALQFEEMWRRLARPSPFTLLEQGCNDGALARDVLGALRQCASPCFASTACVLIEPIALLRQRQQAALQEFSGKVVWRAAPGEVSPATGVFFVNELLDAFPVHRVRWDGAQWREQFVAWQNDRFVFVEDALSSAALRREAIALPTGLPAGYVTEINLHALEWIAAAARLLERGWVLISDYGHPEREFFRADRREGTLAAWKNARPARDPLHSPGGHDLTAHLNFTALARAAQASGFRVRGFTDQHHFIVGLGKLHFPSEFSPSSPFGSDLGVFRTLMHPNLLGGSFKVLCLEKVAPSSASTAVPAPLAGFGFAEGGPRALGLEED